jgi:DNA ligase D-like protein (predicted 3'-phosphoesterase)
MKKSFDINTYEQKRNTTESGEPPVRLTSDLPDNVFAFQKHDAQTLHYDFRLACDGVLKSWAIPKGPSTDPRHKRLAIRTEDHPMDYFDFEGIIPEGNYGAGRVLLWERGTFRYIVDDNEEHLSDAIEKGHFKVYLEGEKIKGGYAMTRIDDEGEKWLLVKMEDAEADARRNPVNSQPESVKSGKNIDEIQ